MCDVNLVWIAHGAFTFYNVLFISLGLCIGFDVLCVVISMCCKVLYICMYVCMYVCMHVCMHACMHACMHVCMYVILNIHIENYRNIYIYILHLLLHIIHFAICSVYLYTKYHMWYVVYSTLNIHTSSTAQGGGGSFRIAE